MQQGIGPVFDKEFNTAEEILTQDILIERDPADVRRTAAVIVLTCCDKVNDKIGAIFAVRAITGLGLYDAKVFVEAL